MRGKSITFSMFLLLILIFALTNSSFAVKASPDIIEIKQVDNNVIKARIRGDEWDNSIETKDGYAIEIDNNGYWKYITGFENNKPILSETDAHQNPPRGLSKHLRKQKKKNRRNDAMSQNSFASSSGDSGEGSSPPVEESPTFGTFNGSILFILAEFTDKKGTYSEASFASFITNNISDYFSKASYGKVTLSPADEIFGTHNNGVVGWVDLEYNHPNTGSSTDTRNQTLTMNAILKADPYVDFSSYDEDGDGYVDADELAIVVIVAGYERASSVNSPNVWGHRWSLGSPPTVDGVIVGNYHGSRGGYAQFGEVHSNHQATMGIMVHELGHLIFGLPDLYDTDQSSEGIGAYGVMGAGSWGKASSDTYSGETPVLPCAWSRYNLGWIDGTESTSGTVSIVAAGSSSANSSNAAYRLITDSYNEYFWVENRQLVGYDAGLERWLGAGAGGLAIWHIDKNKVNNTEECFSPNDCSSTHFMVSLIQADGDWDLENNYNRGDNTDLWYPGTQDAFDALSTPSSDLYDNTSSSVSITDISVLAETMTARLIAPRITVFDDSFELGALGPEWSTNSTNEGRILVTRDNYPNSGKFHVTMDDTVDASAYSLNELILTLDLTGKTGVNLSFFQMEIGDENHSMPTSFTNSNNSDGVAISADGIAWYRVVDLGITGTNWSYTMFEADLDAAISAAGISYNSTFKIKFQQYDNYPIMYDGFAFDDIYITSNPPSIPIPGTVTPSNTQYNTFVDSPFDLATDFTDNENTITSCEYCASTDGTCDTEWAAATLTGSSPTWTCTETGITGTNGQTLTLNMRAANGGGSGEGLAVTMTVDSMSPTTSDNSSSAWTSASPVSVLLDVDDVGGSGVASTEYCVDTAGSCTPDTSGTSLNVSCEDGLDCLQYVRYFSDDNVGNNETLKTSSLVRQDLKIPADGSLTPTPGSSLIDLAWSGFSDSGSGLDTIDTYKLVYSTEDFPGSYCVGGTEITAITTETSYQHSGLTNGLTYYYRVCAIDAVGNISSGATASGNPTLVVYMLTTSVSPPDSGSVSPDCSEGCTYETGTIVILTAEENSEYYFDYWTNCGSPSNNVCTETSDSEKTITANFQPCSQPIRIAGEPPVYYYSLQEAYDNAVEGDIIQTRVAVFTNDVTADRDISVGFDGGYNCDYSGITGTTTFNGTMRINNGVVTIWDYVFGN